MAEPAPDANAPATQRKRRLRAVFAADVANFSGLVSVNETQTFDGLLATRRTATDELAAHGGWLFGLPGDGIFALFESAVDAVHCALVTQSRLATMRTLGGLKLRIGVHLGEVLFQDDLPFGETLIIAARLESLADPGCTLISSAVMEAVAPRISATFRDCGVQPLKHSPRRIATFSVLPPPERDDPSATSHNNEPLDQTMRFRRPDWQLAGGINPPVVALPAVADALRPPLTNTGDHDTIEACIPELTAILATYLGPIARVLVRRRAGAARTLPDLIGQLAAEIVQGPERDEYLRLTRKFVDR
jgi:class 3 adenylate cyclase